MKITALKDYTESISKDTRFRSGNHFIEVNEKAKSITFDFSNRDYLTLRFEGDKSLVKTFIKGISSRKVMPIHEVQDYLEKYDIELKHVVERVPYLQKTLSL